MLCDISYHFVCWSRNVLVQSVFTWNSNHFDRWHWMASVDAIAQQNDGEITKYPPEWNGMNQRNCMNWNEK